MTYTPSSLLKTVLIKVHTRMTSRDINTVPLKISLYAQWLSEYSCSQIHTQKMPSGYINIIPRNIKQHAQWLSEYSCSQIHTQKMPSGYINIIPRNIKQHAQWLSQYVRPVAISITYAQWQY